MSIYAEEKTEQQIEGDSVGGVIFIGILYFIVLFGIIGTVLMMIAERKRGVSTQACPSCSQEGHDVDADYCKFCGAQL